MKSALKTLAVIPFLAALLIVAPLKAIAAYPDKPIRIIVPYLPGGGSDIMARMVGQKLSEALGQPVVVENKPGAETQIGTEAVAKAAPDGYTLGLVTPALVINKFLYPKAGYDMSKDLRPVALIASNSFFFVVHPSVEAKTLAEFVDLAKRSPGKFSYSGAGSISFIVGESFKRVAGINTMYIPYKGSSGSITAVVAGETQYTFDSVAVVKPLIDAGKLRALGYTAQQRHADTPNVPTMDQAGTKFEWSAWYGFVAPAGVPNDVVTKLNQEVARILGMPDVKKKFEELGAVAFPPMPPEGFGAQLQSDLMKYGDIIKATNLQPN